MDQDQKDPNYTERGAGNIEDVRSRLRLTGVT